MPCSWTPRSVLQHLQQGYIYIHLSLSLPSLSFHQKLGDVGDVGPAGSLISAIRMRTRQKKTTISVWVLLKTNSLTLSTIETSNQEACYFFMLFDCWNPYSHLYPCLPYTTISCMMPKLCVLPLSLSAPPTPSCCGTLVYHARVDLGYSWNLITSVLARTQSNSCRCQEIYDFQGNN